MPTSAVSLNPAYDADECMEILRLAAAVSGFIPLYGGGKDFAKLDPFAPAGGSPIQDIVQQGVPQDGPVMPSLFEHRWPAGWTAGIVKFPIRPTWRHSVVCSIGPSDWTVTIDGKKVPIPTFSNQCILTYNKARDAYCLAFRGTMTFGNVLEDLLALPVSAGPVNFLDIHAAITPEERKIGARLMHGLDDLLDLIVPHWLADDVKDLDAWAKKVAAAIIDKLPAPLRWLTPARIEQFILGLAKSDRSYVLSGIPGVSERAAVHAGFRIALESLDFAPSPLTLPDLSHPSLADLAALPGLLDPNTLTGMLKYLADHAGGKPIKLYVTGHSLGAGIATLAAAWLRTQPIPGAQFDVKLYAFAQPKPGNEYFSYAMASAFGNTGSFAVLNSLDTVPQVAMTLQNLQSLNYVGCIQFLLNAMGPVGKGVEDFFSVLPPWNYVHAGQVVLLTGAPAKPGTTPQQDGFYNLPPVGEVDGKPQYQYPAYLFTPTTPTSPNNTMPPQSAWTLTPTDPGMGDPAMFQALWQHMPWVYMEAMMRARQAG